VSGKNDPREFLPLLAVLAAALCVGELLWLRTARLTPTRGEAAVLFLPWLMAAAANLGLWYVALERAKPSLVRTVGTALFWLTSAAFAFVFAALYAGLLFGWF
jgi:hypothetical protein